MTPRIPCHLSRTLVALACSLALAVPSAAQARAQEPEPEQGAAAGEPTDELNAQAQQHVIKAYQQYQNKAYATAESELRRAAFFAPRWRPLHFNLAVMAEAQGKLGTAVSEYKAFRPFAVGDESMIAEQRIVELDSRRRKIASAYKRQIGIGAITMSLGAAAAGGGIGMFVYGYQLKKDIPEGDASKTKTETASKFIVAGYFVGFIGILVLAYSFVPLSKAIKAKRQLDGLALGPTRLRLAGNGVSLRF